jgi:hypothetical protein
MSTNAVFRLSPGGQGVWQYDGSGTSWTQVGGPAGQIYGGGYGLVATNPSNGDIWRYLGTPNKWQQIGGPGAAFTVTGDTVFGLAGCATLHDPADVADLLRGLLGDKSPRWPTAPPPSFGGGTALERKPANSD